MNSKKIDKQQFLSLIDKYIAGKTNLEEDRLLLNYYESFQKNSEWPKLLGSERMVKERMFKRLAGTINFENQKKNKKLFNPRFVLKYAAIFAGIVFLLYLLKNSEFSEKQFVTSNNTIDSNAITLTLENGNVKIISEKENRKVVDAKGNVIGIQDGNLLKYRKKEKKIKKLVYNELTIPHGKRFDLMLSDGTMVKLNAGTSIKYPIQFIDGEDRRVFIRGEAYFDVTKDENHPFIVNANEINVKVLGTQFNISFYPEDSNISTVLVEGSVLLYKNDELNGPGSPTFLTPGHKASWNKRKAQMSVKKVDISIYTAWKDGILLFKNTSFDNIRKKLERKFNVSIENQYGLLDEQIYTASFYNEESIDDILDYFKAETAFNYKKVDNKIIITKQNN